jgi:secreted trypsin-like serine protease
MAALGVLGLFMFAAMQPSPREGFPFQVDLVLTGFQNNPPDTAAVCSGAWVAPQWVLTAAHCIDRVSGGFLVLQNSQSLAPGKPSLVKPNFVCKHKDSGKGNGLLVNDIGLIRVEPADSAPLTVALPASEGEENSIPEQGADASISVGNLQHGHPLAVKVRTTAKCQQESGLAGKFNENMLCAEEPSPCEGDSGGPLVEMVGGHPELVGIISAGGACATIPRVSTVFTRVSHFKTTWIDPIITGETTDGCTPLDKH